MEDFKAKFGRSIIQVISKSELFSTLERNEEPNSDPLANPYNCDYCDKVFGSRGSLTRHLSTMHKLEKCFVCDVCQERFSMHRELVHHYKIHRVLGRQRSPNLISSTELDHTYCMKSLDNIVLDHPYYNPEKKSPPKLIILEKKENLKVWLGVYAWFMTDYKTCTRFGNEIQNSWWKLTDFELIQCRMQILEALETFTSPTTEIIRYLLFILLFRMSNLLSKIQRTRREE